MGALASATAEQRVGWASIRHLTSPALLQTDPLFALRWLTLQGVGASGGLSVRLCARDCCAGLCYDRLQETARRMIAIALHSTLPFPQARTAILLTPPLSQAATRMRGSEQQFLGWGQGVPSSRVAMCCLCRSSLLNRAFRNAVFTLAHGCLCSRVVLSHLASLRVVSSRCVSCCLLSSPLVSSRVLSSLLFSPHFHLRIHHSCFGLDLSLTHAVAGVRDALFPSLLSSLPFQEAHAQLHVDSPPHDGSEAQGAHETCRY